MNLAIVEPEAATAHLLAFVARRRGHQTVCVQGFEPLFSRLPFSPSVTIVSVAEVTQDVLSEIARMQEQYPDTPIVIATEHANDMSTIQALEAGVRDVIQKPFHPQELILRAEALIKGSRQTVESNVARLADLEVDLDRFSATKNGVPLRITKLELRLLYCLAQNYPHLSSMERLLSFGWDDLEPPDASLLKTHVSHLRKKLREAGGAPIEIYSRQSVGYAIRIAVATPTPAGF